MAALSTRMMTSRTTAAKRSSAESISKTGSRGSNSTPAVTKQEDPIGTAKVTCSSLNVRSGAGTSFGRIGGLTKGKTVQVYEEKDGWLKVAYGTGMGWISKQYTDYKGSTQTQEPEKPKEPENPTTEPEKPTESFQSFNAKVSGVSALWVRTGPSTSYDQVQALNQGTVVKVVGESNGWYQIEYNGISGWMSGKYLEKVDGSTTGGSTGGKAPETTIDKTFEVVVSASSLNVRTGPSTDYGKIGSLSNGQRVTVIGESNGWYKINYNGQEGWISAGYTYDPNNVSAAGQKAADHARSLMQTCVSGGWTYDQNKRTQDGHYDCSAFTHRCWAAAGYSFGWANSESQAKKIYNGGGEIASTAQAQPGDLVFYHTNWNSGSRWRGINHVAICVGGGHRIDAGGTPVKEVSDLGSPVMIGRPSVLMK